MATFEPCISYYIIGNPNLVLFVIDRIMFITHIYVSEYLNLKCLSVGGPGWAAQSGRLGVGGPGWAGHSRRRIAELHYSYSVER